MNEMWTIEDNAFGPGLWRLGIPLTPDGTSIDPRIFTSGTPIDEPPELTIPIVEAGEAIDFTFAGFELPVVSERLGRALERVAGGDVQLVPVQVGVLPSVWHVLNITSLLASVDSRRSGICWWTSEDPEPRGKSPYRMILTRELIPPKEGRTHLSRVAGWNHLIVCHQDVKDTIERHQHHGLRFRAVGNR